MATRLIPSDLSKTEQTLGEILQIILPSDERCAMLVPAGQGFHVCARLRTKISRMRKKVKAMGRSTKKFELRTTIHAETHDGKRYDCIVLWKEINTTHIMQDTLEGMLANV